MFEVKVIDNISKIEWEKLLASSSTSSYFQSPESHEFFGTLSFLETFGWGVFSDGELKALVCGYKIKEGKGLKGYFSRRAIVHSGLLLADNCSDDVIDKLLEHVAAQLRKKVIYVEIRNYHDYSKYRSIFEQNGFAYHEHLNFHIKTQDQEAVFAQLSVTKRRDVRISLKNGVELIQNPTIEHIRDYYILLKDLYDSKIKLPLFPLEFFEKLFLSDLGKFFLLNYNGKVIGGSVCVIFQNDIIYEVFVCGLDNEYKNIYASTVATWFALEYAASNGIKYLDMMGAGKPDDKYGVREFKEKFGGEMVEFGRFLSVFDNFLYRIGKFFIETLKYI